MSLFEGKKNKNYEIKGLYDEEGITGALIIRVRGTRLAIGKHISSGIEVEEVA